MARPPPMVVPELDPTGTFLRHCAFKSRFSRLHDRTDDDRHRYWRRRRRETRRPRACPLGASANHRQRRRDRDRWCTRFNRPHEAPPIGQGSPAPRIRHHTTAALGSPAAAGLCRHLSPFGHCSPFGERGHRPIRSLRALSITRSTLAYGLIDQPCRHFSDKLIRALAPRHLIRTVREHRAAKRHEEFPCYLANTV